MIAAEAQRRLERALRSGGGTHTVADVAEAIRAGRAQWWSNGDGMVVTEVHQFPRLKTLQYWLIFGELSACLALEDEIAPWAIDQDCTVATATGRRGWGPIVERAGWKLWHPTWWKPLTPGGNGYGQ